MVEKVPPEPVPAHGPEPRPEPGGPRSGRLSRPPESADRVQRKAGAEAEDPSWAASLTIKTRHTSLVARGHASVTAAVGIAGIFCAVLTSYIASRASPHAWPWFLGLAAAELAVAALTIIRITKPSRFRSL